MTTSFGTAPDPSLVQYVTVQASNPGDLQLKLQNAFELDIPLGSFIMSFGLSGGGDGNVFLATVGFVPFDAPDFDALSSLINIPDSISVRAFAFTDEQSFIAQRALVTYVGTCRAEEIALAGQGPLGMCVSLSQQSTGLVPNLAPNSTTPYGKVSGRGMAGSIVLPTTIITGAAATGMTLFADSYLFETSGLGLLKYIGTGPLRCVIRGGISLELSSEDALSATLNLVQDPTGIPVALDDGVDIVTLPALVGYMSSEAMVTLAPEAELALQVSNVTGTGTVRSAWLSALAVGVLN